MYESHFGLSGPPFQLVPDPGFFFGSRGHSNALAFLQSAAHQGDGFLVVTGEIGAGKTTLVRTLLEGLDVQQVVAATMVSTQLESGDLPPAILLAFGAPQGGESKAQLNASLEAFLMDLAARGRRALLIVDEAQNLSHALIEELRMLSNLQVGVRPLLQVFLVGQPELRTLLQAKSMEQLRQRVTASCHLGPMDVNETRAYVEHRLRRVGWVDRPPIEEHAFVQIHQWTAGIPRRINRLCNRLLLATFLERKEAISAEAVEQIARDLRAEIGESDDQPKMEQSYVPEPAPATEAVAAVSMPTGLAGAEAASPNSVPPQEIVLTPAPEAGQQPTADSSLAEETASGAEVVNADPSWIDPLPSPELSQDADIPDALTAFEALPAFSLAQQARAANEIAGTQGLPEIKPANSTPTLSEIRAPSPVPGQISQEPVLEEDEDPEAEPMSGAASAPPDLRRMGVVAAHEVHLPPMRSVLERATLAQPAVSGEPGVAPASLPAGYGQASPASHVVPTAAAAPAVDLPLDFTHANVPAIAIPAATKHPGKFVAPAMRSNQAVGPSIASSAAPGKGVLEPLVCLVDSPADYIKARALGRVLRGQRELPALLIVHTGNQASLEVGEEVSGVMPQNLPDVHLDISEHGGAASAALAITRFDAVLRVYRPKAILAMGASDSLLTCALFAHKSGIPVLRNDAGRRRAWSRPGEEMNAMLLERLADTCYISELATYYTLYRSGISTERVLLVGNLADNVVHYAAEHTVHPAEILRRVGVAAEALSSQQGYALCTVQFDPSRAANDDLPELLAMLSLVGKELPVIWATNVATLHELKTLGKLAALKSARIDVAPSLLYLDCIDLLRGARCLLSGNAGRHLDDAVTLGVPSIVLGHGMVVPVKNTEALQLSAALGADQLTTVLSEMLAGEPLQRERAEAWDGATASRIAAHLHEWLPQFGVGKKRGKAARTAVASAAQRPKHPDAAIEMMGASVT